MSHRDRHPLGARVGTSEGLTRRMQGETEGEKTRRETGGAKLEIYKEYCFGDYSPRDA